MNLPLYISKRYLLAKKSHNAINIISAISVIGVTVGTMALIVVLSVFNGFDSLVQSLFNSFNPDLKVLPASGKVFIPEQEKLNQIKNLEGVFYLSAVLEDKALLKYEDKQTIAIIKGVDENYSKVTGIDSMIIDGTFVLTQDKMDYAVIGQGIAIFLGVGLQFISPINIYIPRRLEQVSLNPERALNRKYIFPSGIFSIQQDFDSKYVLTPLRFAKDLLEYNNEISSVELKLDPLADAKVIQESVKKILGEGYIVKNRFQQNELFYKTMQTEKWAIFLILAFILIIASFNVIGSLTMLIIEKKNDISTLRNLGANIKLIRKVFLFEGWMISFIGSLLGLGLGLLICWLQQRFELVKLQGSGSFVIDSYPVSIEFFDVITVFFTVVIIGFIASWYPIRYITRKFILQ